MQLKFKRDMHPFHLVAPSYWPILIAVMLFNCIVSLLHYINFFNQTVTGSFYILIYLLTRLSWFQVNICVFFIILWRWFIDIIVEATFEGNHTKKVRQSLYLGINFFILSEIMFFFTFFWAFFHNALSPSINIGYLWPPLFFWKIDPFGLPLLNTALLLASGVTITYSQLALLTKNRETAIDGLICTLGFGIAFIYFQFSEYKYSSFSINDGVYGSIFYLLTGFHGLHVLIGCILLSVSLVRMVKFHFNSDHHLGYEASILYWHMVDAVWLFVFIFLYIWGN